MAVAFDAKSTLADNAIGASSPRTHSNMTVGSGTNRVLITTLYFSIQTPSITAVTWDSGGTPQTMTLIKSQTTPGALGFAALYGLVAPTSGNKTLNVAWSGGTSDISICCAAYTGAKQTFATAFVNAVSNTGNSTTASTGNVTTATTDVVVAHHCNAQFGWTSTSNTEIYHQAALAGGSAANYEVGGASPQVLTVVWNGTDNWASVAADIAASVTASSNTMLMMGVG